MVRILLFPGLRADKLFSMLRYVNAGELGFVRLRRGRGYAYLDPHGAAVQDAATKRRLAALAVPPAWKDVWLCADPHGHIQATGRDHRGRKQYIYHPAWRARQERSKFEQLRGFAEALPAVRRQVDRDLRAGMPGERAVLAAAVKLLDLSGIRVGNKSYFDANGTVGLTTLQDRNTDIEGGHIELRFKAKSGRRVDTSVEDRRLANLLLRCEELPGQRLFRYRSGDTVSELDSTQLNSYLREAAGCDVSAKDFRTWIATVTVVELWVERRSSLSIKDAAAAASKRLENTAAVVRRSYIHPGILELAIGRAPSDAERQTARRGRVRLSGAEALCARLLRTARSGV
ncbi:MAG TPA: DNA topoisomerase IB [Gammaproteobacteria bacterium]|nr:DNA topoisomerase IB [Gammaproteobacteria bacterium]